MSELCSPRMTQSRSACGGGGRRRCCMTSSAGAHSTESSGSSRPSLGTGKLPWLPRRAPTWPHAAAVMRTKSTASGGRPSQKPIGYASNKIILIGWQYSALFYGRALKRKCIKCCRYGLCYLQVELGIKPKPSFTIYSSPAIICLS